MNRGVLSHLLRNASKPVVTDPEGHPDPYERAGSHPDVVIRIWDELGTSARGLRRCLLSGTPALFQPRSGLVFVVALGTSYALRLSPQSVLFATQSGAETKHHFRTADFVLDLRETFGPDWVFGSWHKLEADWLTQSVEFFNAESDK